MSQDSIYHKFNIYDIFEDNYDEIENSNTIESLSLLKCKTGRKSKSEKEKINNDSFHSKYSPDNMRTKIIRKFLKFSFLFFINYFEIKSKIDNLKIKYKIILKSFNSTLIKKIMDSSIYEFCRDYIFIDTNSFSIFYNLLHYLYDDFDNLKMSDFYEKFFLSKNFKVIKKEYSINKNIKNFYELLETYNKEIEYKNELMMIGENLMEFINKFAGKKVTNQILVEDDHKDSFSLLNDINSNDSESYMFQFENPEFLYEKKYYWL